MSNKKRNDGLEAKLIRRFQHPLERVYRAWTQPQHMARWFSPAEEIELSILKYQLHEGGEYLFRYEWPEGVFPVSGSFLTVMKEDCLIFTWEPQEPDVDAGKETLVSVWFREVATRVTELELRHTLLPDELMRQRHESGWESTLKRFGNYLPECTGLYPSD